MHDNLFQNTPDLWPPNSPDLNPVELCLEYSAGESVRNLIREHR